MKAKNTSELNKELNKRLEAAINEIANNMYNSLIDCIESNIYDAPEGEKYERKGKRGGFLGAFKLSDIKKTSISVSRTLFYDWMSMSLSGNGGYTHGNQEANIDRRKDLWWILDNTYDNVMNSDFGGAYGVQNPSSVTYLEEFNAIVQRDFNKWVNKALKKQGLSLVK